MDVLFANPFSGALKLQLNLVEAKQVAVNVFDMQEGWLRNCQQRIMV